jgi:tetratricopeptide (TPR) repeat protein
VAANPRVEELRKRLEREPGSRLFAQYAEELRRAGELAEAVKVCREGLEKHSAYPSARITLGRALLDLGSVAEAAAEFAAVLAAAPDNLSASRYLGECLEKQGDTSAALKRYQTALLHAPGDEWMRSRVAALGAGEEGAAPSAGAGADGQRRTGGPKGGPPPLPPGASGGRPGTAAGVDGGAAGAASRPVQGAAKPIPLVPVDDEGFELETAHEAAAAAGARAAGRAAGRGQGSVAVSAVADDEEFELETAGPLAARAGARELTFRPLPMDEDEGRAARSAAAHDGTDLPPIRAQGPSGGAPELASGTLAELYLKQGAVERAVAIYEELAKSEPGNPQHAQRLAEARRRRSAGGPPGRAEKERAVRRLEGALASIRAARQRAGSRG